MVIILALVHHSDSRNQIECNQIAPTNQQQQRLPHRSLIQQVVVVVVGGGGQDSVVALVALT